MPTGAARNQFQVSPVKGGQDPDLNNLVTQLNRHLLTIGMELARLEGLGNQTMRQYGDVDFQGKKLRGVGPALYEGDVASRGIVAQQGALSRATQERVEITSVVEAQAGIVTPVAVFQDAAPAFSQIDSPAPSGSSSFPGGISVGSGGSAITKIIAASALLDFPNTLTQTSSDTTLAVSGAVTGDVVAVGVPAAAVNANSEYSARVSASDVVTVRFNNYSGGAINPASATFRVVVIRF